MTTGRNQFGTFDVPRVINQFGEHDNVAVFEDLTLDDLQVRGGIIVDSSGCHAWTRGKTQGWGYGVINMIGLDGKRKSHLAHRVTAHLSGITSYDSTDHVLHSCDKRWCVNPEHLRAGTNADNAHDRVERRKIRPTWNDTWFTCAQIVAQRSECVRRQAGCVLVGLDNRIVATGFNGKPDGLDVSGPCDGYCPRATTGGSLDYSDCVFVHGEMNALIFSDRSRREGGSAYVTSCPCSACAKALSNSGISRVICSVGSEDRNRSPERSIELMMNSGLYVEIVYYPPHSPIAVKL